VVPKPGVTVKYALFTAAGVVLGLTEYGIVKLSSI
jgi:hypothetical protein